ncbi:hypothetical protein KUV89_10225 [Marinobacter hydrocarbonoclasticus]|nr:hypothetical protein [Marinobacter nauticus]
MTSRDPLSEQAALTGTQEQQDTARAIYRANRQGALERAVLLAFPMTEHLLGTTLMNTLIHHYGQTLAAPPRLDLAGQGLLGWLLNQPQGRLLIADYPFLPALLRYEWGWHQAYHSPACPAVSPETCLGWIDAPEGTPPWHCHPALTVVTSRYPIRAIHHTLRALKAGHSVEALDTLPGVRHHWAIWPEPDAVGLMPTDATIWPLLRWLRAPLSMSPPQPDLLAMALQRGWLIQGCAASCPPSC